MRGDDLRLADMLEALEHMRGFCSGGRGSFFSDPKTQAAVAYELLKLGEAASRLSRPFRKIHPEALWSRLINLRNEMAHEYFRVDPDVLWEFVETELDDVERAIRPLSTKRR